MIWLQPFEKIKNSEKETTDQVMICNQHVTLERHKPSVTKYLEDLSS